MVRLAWGFALPVFESMSGLRNMEVVVVVVVALELVVVIVAGEEDVLGMVDVTGILRLRALGMVVGW